MDTNSPEGLNGKVALITGGSRGIGAATAETLAQQGADVVLTYVKDEASAAAVAAKIIGLGRRVLTIQNDAFDPASQPEVVDSAMKTFGRLDILVNNAGVFEGVGHMVGDIPDEALERIMNINVKSMFAITQATAKVMSDHRRIINVSSVLGYRAIFAGASAYTMSKFAVNGMTRAWAWNLAPRNITVNSVEPGPIRTGMGDPGAARLTALKRLGEPSEVAAVIAFLAIPVASFVTGATIRVDGGVNA